jgi:peroxiredoxin
VKQNSAFSRTATFVSTLRHLFLFLLLASAVFAGPAMAGITLGDEVPPLDVRLLDGKVVNLRALKAKPVLVTFWATWCPPCIKEMSDLQQLYERYHGQGLEIIAISVNTERAQVDEFIKARGFTYPMAMSVPRHVEIFGPMLLPPKLYLIDPGGKVALSHWGPVRPEALEATIKAML